MLFNQSKCKCLHIGRANGKEPYEMDNTVLLKTSKEKGRGDTKCRLESVGTMWNCSQKGEPATRDDQKRNIIYRKKPFIIPYINQLLDRI